MGSARNGKQTRARFFSFLVPLAVFVFVSCASTNPYLSVDQAVEREDYARGAETLEAKSKTIYRSKDKVLYCLDKGMLLHYAGDWQGSSALLEEGEKKIQENYAVSISQEVGTYLLNDRAREYDGEDYEDIYLNVFNALNYHHRGESDEALVEIRRISNKLKNLQAKYGTQITSLQKQALENNAQIPPNPQKPLSFSDSALARYMGMLFYRGEGLYDDARIDRNALKTAMADAPEVYSNKIPSSIDDELAVPKGMARLNVVAFSGKTPVKTENTVRIPLGVNWIKIALPVITPRPSQVTAVEAVLDTGERFPLELLEDIGKVAQATFGEKSQLIYLKSIVRATVKGGTAVAFDAIAQSEQERGNDGTLFALLSLGTQLFAEATEQADLRSTRYFPGRAWVGGANLPAGNYSFTVNYYAGGSVVASRRFENVPVLENRLNLQEAVCLR